MISGWGPRNCWRDRAFNSWMRYGQRLRWGRISGWRFWSVLLHQAVDFEPVWSSSISRSRFWHPHHQAFAKSASLASCSVFLVNNTSVVILALLYNRLVVACSTKERLASLAGESPKMKTSCRFFANPTKLILKRIHLLKLNTNLY